jgi:triosephosphate isomerase
MSRPQIAAGNWKMNTDIESGVSLAEQLIEVDVPQNTMVILAPPYTHLSSIDQIIREKNGFYLASQNMSQHEKGAYTGEISASMLKSVGVSHVIIGHSERREYFGDTDEIIGEKVKSVLDNGLKPILCVGESLQQRESGNHFDVVAGQLEKGLANVRRSNVDDVIVAYEPVWAIGTGVTASPAQAQEIHEFIRLQLEEKFGQYASAVIPILYGGSVNAGNATELFSNPDVDGGLVGGAALKSDDFKEIILA